MSKHSAPLSTTHRRETGSSGARKLLILVTSLATAAFVLLSPFTAKALSQAARWRTRAATVRQSSASTVPAANRSWASSHPSRTGYWHTRGGRILDAHQAPVRISGVNWSGFETTAAVPGGLTLQDYHFILRSVAASGYNTIRLPFSNEMVENPAVPTAIRFDNEHGPINGDLAGLNSLQILDRIVAASGELGLKVILDDHRSEAGSSAEANGLWYTEQYPESAWIADWVSLASRYKGNPTVIGVDLRNEPHQADLDGACWDCGGPHDWHLAAQRAGNAVLRTNSSLLVFVEGTDRYGAEGDFWGGDLEGVRTSPVRLAIANRLVYSPHVYGPAEYKQAWFNPSTTPASLRTLWQRHWAFISESGIAPVWIGEFGTPNDDIDVANDEPGSEGQWFQTLIGFLDSHTSIGWSYWGINGEDRYGLLDSSYQPAPANRRKAAALAGIRLPEQVGTGNVVAGQNSEPVQTSSLTPLIPEAGSGSTSMQVSAPSVTTALPSRIASVHARSVEPGIESSVAEQVRRATAQALLTQQRSGAE